MSASEIESLLKTGDPAICIIMVSEAGQAEGCYFEGIH
jgi:hypothetical protein